jgi:hypothetical protein
VDENIVDAGVNVMREFLNLLKEDMFVSIQSVHVAGFS